MKGGKSYARKETPERKGRVKRVAIAGEIDKSKEKGERNNVMVYFSGSFKTGMRHL